MAKFYSKLNDSTCQFIKDQKIFFTGSAPEEGKINLSPKGLDTFRILDFSNIAYLDLTGSGNETSAHINQNGRLTIMFCGFEENPLILRLYGKGKIILPDSPEWETIYKLFPVLPGTRQIVHLNVETVQTSCGFGVPEYKFIQHREKLNNWAIKKGEQELIKYREEKNQFSIDGLPCKT